MKNEFVEVKSALWQKIFVSFLCAPCAVVGVVGWASPWVPAFRGGAPSVRHSVAMGFVSFACGLALWWPVMRYTLRADKEGLFQTNGFFRQSIRWSDVSSYFLAPNPRFYAQQRLHVEPVMFDANGKVVFHGFAPIFKSTSKIIEQRREFWRFVEAQLEGKKRDAPVRELTPELLARRSLQTQWSGKD